jgi:transposase
MEIRDTIYNMYADKKHVTVKSLNTELKRKYIVDISTASLYRLLGNIGFSFKQDDNRRALCEQSHVLRLRTNFLRSFVRHMESPKPLDPVFLDETWIFAKGGSKRSWQNDSFLSVRKPRGDEGKRFIVLHAGNSDGFIEGASLVFSSTAKTSDYHDNMNAVLFTKWMEEQLLPSLEKPSLLILDNAPYHSVEVEKQPVSSWKKRDIEKWLVEKNISFSSVALKHELLYTAQNNKQPKRYVIDELVNKYGHQVLRLPPYHCQFNAIEEIWGITKVYYKSHMGRDGYGDDKVLAMWKESLNQCTNEIWQKVINRTK